MNEIKVIATKLREAQSVGIFGHIKTDGDCVGCCLSLSRALSSLGKRCSVFIDSSFSEDISFLSELSEINSKPREKFDLLIALDTANAERLGKHMKYFLKHRNTIQVDHHLDNTEYAKINYAPTGFSAGALVLFELLQELGVKITSDIAKFLLVGILTDTGGFKYRNVDSLTLRYSAELFKFADFEWSDLTYPIFFKTSKRRRLVQARALSNMKFFHDDRIVVVPLFFKDLQELEASLADSANMSFLGLDIEAVEAVIMMTEGEKGVFSITFNSREKDISPAARFFGGGGHTNAAGCKLFGKFEQILNDVVDAAWKAIR